MSDHLAGMYDVSHLDRRLHRHVREASPVGHEDDDDTVGRHLTGDHDDPLGAGWNIIQSKIALGSGGLLGKGYGLGSQSQLEFLPERHTDFIFSTVSEEFGFLGSFTMLGCYIAVILIALRIASQCTGFNLGMNQGVTGGAGISAHLHQHVVPRWSGDGNFLPIIARTKNMAQTLGTVRDALAEVWPRAEAEFDGGAG